MNAAKRFVIFGAWDKHTDGERSEIFSEAWEFNHKGRRSGAYKQSREHIRLVEEEGFALFTFPMQHSEARQNSVGEGPAKMKGFVPVLSKRSLLRVGRSWYASDGKQSVTLAEEVGDDFSEGGKVRVTVNAYERNPKARKACLKHHGYRCAACGMLFEEKYGDIGSRYIHVHHITPISQMSERYEINPVRDLVPVCPNCHAMIHLTVPPLTVEQLKSKLIR